jgi:hypothetical protein
LVKCSGQGGGFVSCSPKYIIKKKIFTHVKWNVYFIDIKKDNHKSCYLHFFVSNAINIKKANLHLLTMNGKRWERVGQEKRTDELQERVREISGREERRGADWGRKSKRWKKLAWKMSRKKEWKKRGRRKEAEKGIMRTERGINEEGVRIGKGIANKEKKRMMKKGRERKGRKQDRRIRNE